MKLYPIYFPAQSTSRGYSTSGVTAAIGSGAGISSIYNGSRQSQYDWQSPSGGLGKASSGERNLSTSSPVVQSSTLQRVGQTFASTSSVGPKAGNY